MATMARKEKMPMNALMAMKAFMARKGLMAMKPSMATLSDNEHCLQRHKAELLCVLDDHPCKDNDMKYTLQHHVI